MIVTIDTVKQTVTISNITHFGQLVDWEDYYDYEVIIASDKRMSMDEYLDAMDNPSHT